MQNILAYINIKSSFSTKNMSFYKSTLIVSSCTLMSRFFGFLRDIIFAQYLGTGFYSDIFFTAFKLPNFFRNLFAEGAFNSAFVPIFSSQLASNNEEKIEKFSKNIFSILLYFLLLVTIIIEIFMPRVINIIANGFSSDVEKYDLAIKLTRITFPYLIFISLVSFISGILNSYGKFVATSLNQIILNVTFIVFSLLSSYININIAETLSYAVLIGGILQFICLFFFSCKNGNILYPIRPEIDVTTKKFLNNFFSGLIGSGIVQINSMIDSVMATKIAGAVSYLYYADRIAQLPLSLIGTALSVSILPVLSKKLELKDKESFDIQENAILIAIFLGLPCALALNRLSHLIIPVLFQRGKFGIEASTAVSGCLKLYSLALPAFIISKLLQTIFYSNKDTKTPMVASFLFLISNIFFNILLIKKYSFYGIIISTIISSYLNMFILLLILIRQKRLKISDNFKVSCAKIFYISIFMFMVLLLCDKYIVLNKFLKLVLSGLISGSVYMFLAYRLKTINLEALS